MGASRRTPAAPRRGIVNAQLRVISGNKSFSRPISGENPKRGRSPSPLNAKTKPSAAGSFWKGGATERVSIVACGNASLAQFATTRGPGEGENRNAPSPGASFGYFSVRAEKYPFGDMKKIRKIEEVKKKKTAKTSPVGGHQ